MKNVTRFVGILIFSIAAIQAETGQGSGFKPIVRDSMNSVGVTRQVEDLNNKLSGIPMGGSLGFDLDQYVTDKSLKGLLR